MVELDFSKMRPKCFGAIDTFLCGRKHSSCCQTEECRAYVISKRKLEKEQDIDLEQDRKNDVERVNKLITRHF